MAGCRWRLSDCAPSLVGGEVAYARDIDPLGKHICADPSLTGGGMACGIFGILQMQMVSIE